MKCTLIEKLGFAGHVHLATKDKEKAMNILCFCR